VRFNLDGCMSSHDTLVVSLYRSTVLLVPIRQLLVDQLGQIILLYLLLVNYHCFYLICFMVLLMFQLSHIIFDERATLNTHKLLFSYCLGRLITLLNRHNFRFLLDHPLMEKRSRITHGTLLALVMLILRGRMKQLLITGRFPSILILVSITAAATCRQTGLLSILGLTLIRIALDGQDGFLLYFTL